MTPPPHQLKVLIGGGGGGEEGVGVGLSRDVSLWGTCWVPIVRVLTEGALDPRPVVRFHALELLR